MANQPAGTIPWSCRGANLASGFCYPATTEVTKWPKPGGKRRRQAPLTEMVDGPAGHRNPSSSDESCLGLGCQGQDQENLRRPDTQLKFHNNHPHSRLVFSEEIIASGRPFSRRSATRGWKGAWPSAWTAATGATRLDQDQAPVRLGPPAYKALPTPTRGGPGRHCGKA